MNTTASKAKFFKKRTMFKIVNFFILSGILFLLNSTNVLAGCEDPYLKRSPGGDVPTTDITKVSNCPHLTYQDGNGIPCQSCCSDRAYTKTEYCSNLQYFKAIAGGEIRVYAQGAFFKVSDTHGHHFSRQGNTTDIGSGIEILAGDDLLIQLGEYNATDGPGWRTYNSIKDGSKNNFFINAKADALTKGYTILSEQLWADALTSSRYDSYDFDDLGIVVAVKNTLVPPTCGSFSLSLNTPTNVSTPGSPIFLGEQVLFQTSSGVGDSTLYNFISNTFSPLSLPGCSPKLNNPQTCQILNKATTDNPTHAVWQHKYKNCNGAGCSEICIAEKDLDIFPYPGFLITEIGDTFLRGPTSGKALDQIKFPSTQVFSKYTFGSGKPISQHTPNNAANLSFKSYLLMSYNDSNNTFDYPWLSKRLLSDPRLTEDTLSINVGFNTVFTQTNFDSLKTNKIKLVHVNNDFTIKADPITHKILCKYPTMFLIEGNLILYPDLNIEGDNACMFIVKESTTIRQENINDRINTFIITGNYFSEYANGTLTNVGGVINWNNDHSVQYYKRNKNLLVIDYNLVDKINPSEIFNYEGARYIYHFGTYLENPFFLSIKEIQYTSNL